MASNDIIVRALRPGSYQSAITVTDAVGNTLTLGVTVQEVHVPPTIPQEEAYADPQIISLNYIGQVVTAHLVWNKNGYCKTYRVGLGKSKPLFYTIKRGIKYTYIPNTNLVDEEIQVEMKDTGYDVLVGSMGNPATQTYRDTSVSPPYDYVGYFVFYISCGGVTEP